VHECVSICKCVHALGGSLTLSNALYLASLEAMSCFSRRGTKGGSVVSGRMYAPAPLCRLRLKDAERCTPMSCTGRERKRKQQV